MTSNGSSSMIYVLTALSCIGGFLFGYDTGVISGALVQIGDKFSLNDWEKEMVVSITVAGALIATVIAGPCSDKYGRKPIVLVSSIVFMLGAVIMAIAESYDVLIIGRLVVGLGVGAASTSMPVFVSEAAPSHLRGVLVTCVNLAVTGGQFIAACVSGFLIDTKGGWRYMVGIAGIPAFLQFVGFIMFVPESPRWLIEHDKIDEAVAALQFLRGHYDVREEVQEIQMMVEEETSKKVEHTISDKSSLLQNGLARPGNHFYSAGESWVTSSVNAFIVEMRKLFIDSPAVRRALLVGCALQAAQQIAGINTIMYYTATILKLAGFTSDFQAVWLSAAVSFCNFIGTVFGLYFVDSIGRRKLTLTSLLAVSIVLLGIAIAFYEAQINSAVVDVSANVGDNGHCNKYKYCFDCSIDSDCGFCTDYNGSGNSACVSGDNDAADNPITCPNTAYYGEDCPMDSKATTLGWMIFMLMCLYLLAFAPGMGSMPWCINAEIYPTNIRGSANAVATTVNWGSNFVMSATFLTLMSAITRTGSFVLYSALSIAFFIFFYFYLPETKGKVLEDIQKLFDDMHFGRAHEFVKDKLNVRRSSVHADDKSDVTLYKPVNESVISDDDRSEVIQEVSFNSQSDQRDSLVVM